MVGFCDEEHFQGNLPAMGIAPRFIFIKNKVSQLQVTLESCSHPTFSVYHIFISRDGKKTCKS